MNTVKDLEWERYRRAMDAIVTAHPDLVGRHNPIIESEIAKMSSTTITIRIATEENEALERYIDRQTKELQKLTPGAKVSKSAMVRALLVDALRRSDTLKKGK